MIYLCKAVLRALILLHVPRNGLFVFPRDWNKVDLPTIPQILLLVLLKTIIYNNLFHMLLHTRAHHTLHNLCTVLSQLSCGHLFDHPSLPKIIWGERKGGMRNAHVPLKGNSPSDSWEFQSYNNPFCSYCRNPTQRACPLEPVQVQQCWTRRSGSAVTVTLCCKHVQKLPIHSVHPLPQKQFTGKEKEKLAKFSILQKMKHIHSSCLLRPSETHTHTQNKEWNRRLCVSLSTYQEDVS